jgi:hypothetical protein
LGSVFVMLEKKHLIDNKRKSAAFERKIDEIKIISIFRYLDNRLSLLKDDIICALRKAFGLFKLTF